MIFDINIYIISSDTSYVLIINVNRFNFLIYIYIEQIICIKIHACDTIGKLFNKISSVVEADPDNLVIYSDNDKNSDLKDKKMDKIYKWLRNNSLLMVIHNDRSKFTRYGKPIETEALMAKMGPTIRDKIWKNLILDIHYDEMHYVLIKGIFGCFQSKHEGSAPLKVLNQFHDAAVSKWKKLNEEQDEDEIEILPCNQDGKSRLNNIPSHVLAYIATYLPFMSTITAFAWICRDTYCAIYNIQRFPMTMADSQLWRKYKWGVTNAHTSFLTFMQSLCGVKQILLYSPVMCDLLRKFVQNKEDILLFRVNNGIESIDISKYMANAVKKCLDKAVTIEISSHIVDDDGMSIRVNNLFKSMMNWPNIESLTLSEWCAATIQRDYQPIMNFFVDAINLKQIIIQDTCGYISFDDSMESVKPLRLQKLTKLKCLILQEVWVELPVHFLQELSPENRLEKLCISILPQPGFALINDKRITAIATTRMFENVRELQFGEIPFCLSTRNGTAPGLIENMLNSGMTLLEKLQVDFHTNAELAEFLEFITQRIKEGQHNNIRYIGIGCAQFQLQKDQLLDKLIEFLKINRNKKAFMLKINCKFHPVLSTSFKLRLFLDSMTQIAHTFIENNYNTWLLAIILPSPCLLPTKWIAESIINFKIFDYLNPKHSMDEKYTTVVSKFYIRSKDNNCLNDIAFQPDYSIF